MKKGDCVIIFTPDDTHYEMAKEALKRGLNCLLTKPAVKLLSEHLDLVEISKQNNVLCSIEVHKRWDPMYFDSSQRIKQNEFGEGFSYFGKKKLFFLIKFNKIFFLNFFFFNERIIYVTTKISIGNFQRLGRY
jgi:hypothetical protein